MADIKLISFSLPFPYIRRKERLSFPTVESLKTFLFMNPPLLLPSPSFRWHFTRTLSMQLKQSDLHMRSSKESCPTPYPAHIRCYSAAASNERAWKRGSLISRKQFQLQYPSLHVPLGGCLLPCEPRLLQQDDVRHHSLR